MPYILESTDIQSLFLWYGNGLIMTSSSATSWKKPISMFKEDSMQIPTQKSRILFFFSDGPVKRLDAHQSTTSVQTMWQYCPDAHQCPEVLNSSRLHSSGRHGNTSGRSSKFDKKLDFLLKHKYRKTVASIWTTRKHRPDAILDKAKRVEELQPSRRQGNTVWTRSFLWKLRAAEVQPSEL
jgi:hypothetical protein